MRRYLLSIVLVLFAVTGIGAYFAYGASDRLPEFRLVTLQGDEAVGENIRLGGSYGGRMRSQFLSVEVRGSYYDRDRSLAQQWRERADADPEIAALIRDHRRFMRGKPRYAWALQNLHKDREWLIYADAALYRRGPSAWDVVATIEMLPLSGGEARRYEVTLDQVSANRGGYVRDVARIGEELHLILRVGNDQFADYILDMSGRLIRKVNLAGGDGEPVNSANRYLTAYPVPAEDSLVIAVTETDPDTGYARNMRFMRYDYASGEAADLAELAVDQKEGETAAVYPAGDQFAVIVHDAQMIRWQLVSADGKAILSPEQSATAEALGGKEIRDADVADEAAYVLMKDGVHHVVAAVDLRSGALLYSGRVELTGAAENADEELKSLRLNNLYAAPREGSN